MRILGIETSCDDTGVAVLECDGENFRVVKNIVASQIKDHAKYGGIVPEIAARRHVDVIYPLLDSMKISRTGRGIDAIAVTIGPGLVPALRIGVEVAKSLAYFWDKPLVGINHLEGHIYSAFMKQPPQKDREVTSPIALRQPVFPALCLLVSGGHTELILMKDHGVYELIGMTRDDAAGEAFDKVAKLIGLPYPGGPEISEKANEGDKHKIKFPRPMLHSGDFDFSFSGLKTAVSVYLKKNPIQDARHLADICASFQEAVVETLVKKTLAAAEVTSPKTVILTGGVSANTALRTELAFQFKQKDPEMHLLFAPYQYTTDNAMMISLAGYFRASKKEFIDPLKAEADPNLRLA